MIAIAVTSYDSLNPRTKRNGGVRDVPRDDSLKFPSTGRGTRLVPAGSPRRQSSVHGRIIQDGGARMKTGGVAAASPRLGPHRRPRAGRARPNLSTPASVSTGFRLKAGK